MGFSKMSTISIQNYQEDDNLQKTKWGMFCGTPCRIKVVNQLIMITMQLTEVLWGDVDWLSWGFHNFKRFGCNM